MTKKTHTPTPPAPPQEFNFSLTMEVCFPGPVTHGLGLKPPSPGEGPTVGAAYHVVSTGTSEFDVMDNMEMLRKQDRLFRIGREDGQAVYIRMRDVVRITLTGVTPVTPPDITEETS